MEFYAVAEILTVTERNGPRMSPLTRELGHMRAGLYGHIRVASFTHIKIIVTDTNFRPWNI